jgi:hypothetical protein
MTADTDHPADADHPADTDHPTAEKPMQGESPVQGDEPQQTEQPAGSPSPGEPVFLVVGKLHRPHGVRGEMIMEIITDFPERLRNGVVVYVG